MSPLGYNGTIAHVDLGSGTTRIETPDEIFWRRYAGKAGLLGAYLLLARHAARRRPALR